LIYKINIIMQNKTVFGKKNEIERLEIQTRLLWPYEKTVFDPVFFGKTDLSILDIGCNDGQKTVKWFSDNSISKVIGLEYNADLAEKAQNMFHGNKYSFYRCDAEDDSFTETIADIMREKGIEKFDIVYLSCVLMHLSNPAKLLRNIRSILSSDSILVIVEANDRVSSLNPDSENLLEDFLDILEMDPLSGNRKTGTQLPEMLKECGYYNIKSIIEKISASVGENEKKNDIFQTFFSYLPEDISILRKKHPNNPQYLEWEKWVNINYTKLKESILCNESKISIGVRIVTCTGNKNDV